MCKGGTYGRTIHLLVPSGGVHSLLSLTLSLTIWTFPFLSCSPLTHAHTYFLALSLPLKKNRARRNGGGSIYGAGNRWKTLQVSLHWSWIFVALSNVTPPRLSPSFAHPFVSSIGYSNYIWDNIRLCCIPELWRILFCEGFRWCFVANPSALLNNLRKRNTVWTPAISLAILKVPSTFLSFLLHIEFSKTTTIVST